MTAEQRSLFGIQKLNVPRSEIPAVTHIDYSARVQTVHKETNPAYHALISAFERLTGCPVIVNTSFNVRGEPIVCTPEDAFRCFMGTEIEVLAVGNCYLRKEEQNQALRKNYETGLRAGLSSLARRCALKRVRGLRQTMDALRDKNPHGEHLVERPGAVERLGTGFI